MAHYILLMTLTPDGRERMLRNPDAVVQAVSDVRVSDVTRLGLYAVLGDYDFVHLVEAPDNESVARYALELGVRGGLHTATLPAVPVAHLMEHTHDVERLETGAEAEPPASWERLERER